MTVTLPKLQKPNDGKYHWTVDTFYRAVAAGIFDEPNVWNSSGENCGRRRRQARAMRR